MSKMKKCECCGLMFKPSTNAQRFCTITCAEITLANKEALNSALEPIVNVSSADYLTFSKAAVLMGCSRQYIYKLVAEGKLSASRISSRMSFIRRSDIDTLLSSNPYYRVIPAGTPRRNPSVSASSSEIPFSADDFITIEEAVERFHVSNTTIYNRVRLNSILTCRVAGRTYYSKSKLEDVFKANASLTLSKDVAITTTDNIEWLTYKDAEHFFGKSNAAIRTIIYRHNIPTQMINGKKHCSKTHIERQISSCSQKAECENHYTLTQFADMFCISKSIAVAFARQNGICFTSVGKRNYFLKTDVDKLLSGIRRNKVK